MGYNDGMNGKGKTNGMMVHNHGYDSGIIMGYEWDMNGILEY